MSTKKRSDYIINGDILKVLLSLIIPMSIGMTALLIINLIDAYYKAESDRKLGRLRGKLMKQAKTLHARAANNTNPKVKYKLEDLIRLGLLNTGW